MGRQALDELDALWAANVALLEAEPGSDAAVRLSKRRAAEGEGTLVSLHYTDLDILADELAGYGPEVLVRSPLALRQAVRTRLVGVRDAHAGTTAGSAA